MSNKKNECYNDHVKRMRLTLDLLKKHINSNIYNVSVIGFSDKDKFIIHSLENRKISFIIPEEFIDYVKDSEIDYIVSDITKEPPNELRRRFDLVVLTWVLEQLYASDGPAITNTFSNGLNLLIERNVCWFKEDQTKEVVLGWGHVRDYEFKEAIGLMRSLKIIKIRRISGFRIGFKTLQNPSPAGYQNTIFVIGEGV